MLVLSSKALVMAKTTRGGGASMLNDGILFPVTVKSLKISIFSSYLLTARKNQAL